MVWWLQLCQVFFHQTWGFGALAEVATGIRVATVEWQIFLGCAATPTSGSPLPATTVSPSWTSTRRIVWWVPTRASRSRRILIVWSRPILNIIASNSGSLTFRRLIIPFSPLLTETLAANAYNADDYEHNRKYNDKHGDNCLAIQRFISLIVYADPILSFARKWHLIILLKQINWKRPPEQWFFIIFLLIILFLINILFIIVFVVYWTKPARAFWIPIAIVSLSFTALADI